jgi:hypothetical protein
MEVFRQITANSIILKEYPFSRELAMEAYLMENEEILKLDKENFSEVTILDTEVVLKRGNRTNGSRIDILAKYSGEYLGIIELKLNEIDKTSLNQLEDYLKQKEILLKENGDCWTEQVNPKWVGVLIGTEISADLRDKLSLGYEFNGIPIAGMTIKRFRNTNNNEIFVISDTYFRFKYTSKDYSKFIFNGQEYNKGRLVNAVINYYVTNNPMTFAELKSKFPDSIQGSMGVFDIKSRAIDIKTRTGRRRHYIAPEEMIKLQDETICTSTEWNLYNIKDFIDKAKENGLKIEIE